MKTETIKDVKILMKPMLALGKEQSNTVSYFVALDSKGKRFPGMDPEWCVRLVEHIDNVTLRDFGVPFENRDKLLMDLMDLEENVITFNESYIQNGKLYTVNVMDISTITHNPELKTAAEKEGDLLNKVVALSTTNVAMMALSAGFLFCDLKVTPHLIGKFAESAFPFYKKAYKKLSKEE